MAEPEERATLHSQLTALERRIDALEQCCIAAQESNRWLREIVDRLHEDHHGLRDRLDEVRDLLRGHEREEAAWHADDLRYRQQREDTERAHSRSQLTAWWSVAVALASLVVTLYTGLHG